MTEIYNFDSDSQEFLSKNITKVGVDGSEVFPVNSTTVAPPQTGENQVAVWDGSDWSVEHDYRGESYWDDDGNETVIFDRNIAPPVESHKNKPAPNIVALANTARLERNVRLSETDWRASSDLTLSTEWQNYRKLLRDVPQQSGFPNTITWPTEPS